MFRKLVAGSLMVIVSGVSGETLDLTLGEVLARARDGNLSVAIGETAVRAAEFATRRERANLLPSLDLRAQQRTEEPAGSPRRLDFFSGKLVASWTAVDARTIAEYQVSKLERDIAGLAQETNVQDVLALGAQTFFDYQRSLARLAVIEANLERDRTLAELARNRQEAGVATPIDVTRAEVALAQSERQRLEQETQVVDVRLRLLNVLNLPLDLGVTVPPSEAGQPSPLLLETLSPREVLESLPQYRQALRELRRNQVARRAAAWERFPSLSLFGDWGYAGEDAFGGDLEEEWSAGVSVSVPVFEGFRIRANRMQAELLVQQQELVIRQVEQEVMAALKSSITQVRSRYEQIEIARRSADLSQRELELARARFQEGVADNSDLVRAQANLAEAEDGLVQAVYAYNLARLTLARVRGDVRLLLAE